MLSSVFNHVSSLLDGRKGSTAAIQAFVTETDTLTIKRGAEILAARGLGSQGRGEMPEGQLTLIPAACPCTQIAHWSCLGEL